MADDMDEVEIEISEDDILYYILDENDNQIGIVIEQDGEEVEYYFEDDEDEVELDLSELDGETIELEIDEDAIDHYLFDDDGSEIGFVIIQDGTEIECLYDVENYDEEFEDEQDAEANAGMQTTSLDAAVYELETMMGMHNESE